MKTCSKCGESFPLTSEYWPKREDSKDGFRGQCLNCWREKGRKRMLDWRHANPERARAARRRSYWNNPDNERAYARKWYQENKEWVSEYNKLYREGNPEIIRACIDRFYEQNPDYRREYYEQNKEQIAQRNSAWGKANREKTRAAWHRYDARKKGAQGEYTPEDAANIYRFQNGHCKYCNADLEIVGKHLDHIMPLTRGGSNWPTNLQYLCPTCNVSKGSKFPWEFKPEWYFPT